MSSTDVPACWHCEALDVPTTSVWISATSYVTLCATCMTLPFSTILNRDGQGDELRRYVRWTCDACGEQEVTADGNSPVGWLVAGDVSRDLGVPPRDVCAECADLPVNEVLARLSANPRTPFKDKE